MSFLPRAMFKRDESCNRSSFFIAILIIWLTRSTPLRITTLWLSLYYVTAKCAKYIITIINNKSRSVHFSRNFLQPTMLTHRRH